MKFWIVDTYSLMNRALYSQENIFNTYQTRNYPVWRSVQMVPIEPSPWSPVLDRLESLEEHIFRLEY